ncbi:MAG TPA: ribosome silencing factor [Candidatus Kapabacteria bacterium]|nr:ribosome silencing factor [Candidatus Kapabacteria bacterium]
MAKTTKSKTTVKTTTTRKPRAAAKPASKPRVPKDTAKLIAKQAADYALEKKATHIKLLDVRSITPITDFFIICSASSDLQVKAIAENVIVKMREEKGMSPWKSEGWDSLQWVIIDFVDFVVHVFRDTAREFYHLERLWADAPMEAVEDKPAPAKRRVKKA